MPAFSGKSSTFLVSFLALIVGAKSVEAQGLYISEVAANYRTIARYNSADKDLGRDRYANVAWVEVFNNSSHPVSLSSYKLRTGGLLKTSIFGPHATTSVQPVTFDLPQRNIPAGGYFVLAGKTREDLRDSDGAAYVANGDYLPYWADDSGFVELLISRDGKTADFVRFGNDATNPVTQGRWRGDNVAAFPSTKEYFGTGSPDPLDHYARSIVRLTANFRTTGTKSDWTHVAFPTPGGPNDVPAGVVDSDEDGIPDSAKTASGTFSGLNLYRMGARPHHRDLFIHVEYMNGSDPGFRPRKESLQKVADAFRPHGIYVHFDVGNLFSRNTNIAEFNLSGNISHERPFADCTQLRILGWSSDPSCTSSVYQFSTLLDVRRKPIFRYMLMASSQPLSAKGSSGIGELPGNKFEVTLGGWNLSSQPTDKLNKLISYQAGTIMHELGHTPGLRHGGFEDRNEKPNYYSVMNYLYQLSGLPSDTAGMGPTQRYYYKQNTSHNARVPGPATTPSSPLLPSTYDRCDLPEGPCGPNFKIDYSDGSGDILYESAVCENRNIGRNCNRKITFDCKLEIDTKCGQDGFGDWNFNGKLDLQRYPGRLAARPETPPAPQLSDYDDWHGLGSGLTT